MSKAETKQNLLSQIDLLESQLQDHDPRLYKTKFALERKKKKQSQSEPNHEEIRQQAVELKQKLVDRKIHHGVKVLRKQVKQAIKLESLKVQKRKKNNPQKAEKIDQEDQQLKKFDTEKLSQLIALKTIKKAYLSTKNSRVTPPELLSPKLVKEILELKDGLENDTQRDIFGRLCKSAGVQSACEELKSSIQSVNFKKSGNKESVSQKKNSKENADSFKEEKAATVPEELGDDGDSEEKSDNESESEPEPEPEQAHPDRIPGAAHMDISGSEDEDEEEDDFLEGAGNLPALPTGYISGSDDDDDDGGKFLNDKTVQNLTSSRKNRRGQRARRKIWEMKYGNNAKHLAKERKEKEEKLQKKEEKRAKREEFSAKAKAEREEKQKSKASADDKPLHPSWQAKKQSIAPMPFQGTKKKFD